LEGTTVAVDAVEVAVEDAVEDEARITLARPMQQEKFFVQILATMCLTTVILVEPVHTDYVLLKHSLRETMIRNGQMNIHRARKAQETILEAAVQAGLDMEAPMKLALLQNEIAQGEFSANVKVPIVLNDSQKTHFSNEWYTYRDRNDNLIKHGGQAFSLIQVQCTQLLQDKMKQDTDWTVVSTSYDPLTLYLLIERKILAQTEDQYPFATVYDH
jgi:hypothetical protein